MILAGELLILIHKKLGSSTAAASALNQPPLIFPASTVWVSACHSREVKEQLGRAWFSPSTMMIPGIEVSL